MDIDYTPASISQPDPQPLVFTPFLYASPSEGDALVQNEITKFMAALSLRTVSEDTRNTRKCQLGMFGRWCLEQRIEKPPQIDREAINRYLQWLRAMGRHQNTLATHAAAIRQFLRWLYEHGFIEREPRFYAPQIRRLVPKFLKREQVLALIEACKDGTPLGVRDLALVEFFVATGCRCGEAWKLDVDHLDLDTGIATVHGKGAKDRIAVLSPSAVEALKAWMAARSPRSAPYDHRAVFLSRSGRRITRLAIYRMVQRRAATAGITENAYPHLLRHTFASHLRQRGAELIDIKELLGHTTIASTQMYAHANPGHLRKVLARYGPWAVVSDEPS